MKKIYSILILGLFIFASCDDVWNTHFENTEIEEAEGSYDETIELKDQTIQGFLEGNERFSKFYEWLKSGEIDKEFERDQKLTVWAVDNETFDMYHNFGEKDSLAIRYHVNNLSFAKSNLRDGLRIKTLCNIYLQININSKDEGDVISVNNVADVKEVYSTQNGTIYVLDNMLMPRVSIYDYLVTLDDRYSIIRDTIFKHNRELFDKVNSTPIGVDKTGNTVYDTVTYIDNPLFATANFISEFEQFTTLLPSNEVIGKCFDKLNDQYKLMGQTFAAADSVLAFEWIKEAMFYKGIITDFSQLDIKSAFNRTWRTSVQKIDQNNPVDLSNGLLYEIEELKIPNNVIISRIKSLVHYYEYLTDEEKSTLYTLKGNINDNGETVAPTMSTLDATPKPEILPNYIVFHMSGSELYNDEFSVEFTPLERYVDGGSYKARVMMVPPGEYDFYMGFHSMVHPYVNFYVNDELLMRNAKISDSTPWNYDRVTETEGDRITGGTSKWDGLGGKVGTFTIEGDDMSTFKVKVEFSKVNALGDPKRLRLYHWSLKPTANNY